MNSIEKFEVFWNIIGDKTRLNGNGYRILVDMALYGYCTTQKQFMERRNWKQSSVSNTFKPVSYTHLLLHEISRIMIDEVIA